MRARRTVDGRLVGLPADLAGEVPHAGLLLHLDRHRVLVVAEQALERRGQRGALRDVSDITRVAIAVCAYLLRPCGRFCRLLAFALKAESVESRRIAHGFGNTYHDEVGAVE